MSYLGLKVYIERKRKDAYSKNNKDKCCVIFEVQFIFQSNIIEYHLKLSSDIPYYLYSCIISDTEPQVARLKALSSPPASEADAFVI